MTVRSLLRLLASLALALFVAASWATPSEAHAGHDGHAAAAQHEQTTTSETTTSETMAVAAAEVAKAASADCGGHGENDSGATACCGAACHAAMSTEMVALQAVTVAVAILPTLPAPPELSGPTIHIKRPPRPSAALVG